MIGQGEAGFPAKNQFLVIMTAPLNSVVHSFLVDVGMKKTAKAMKKESKDTLLTGVSPTLSDIVTKVGLPKKRSRDSSSSDSSSSDSSSSDSDSDNEEETPKAPAAKKAKADSKDQPAAKRSKTSKKDHGFSASSDANANAYRKKHSMKLDADVDFSPFQTFDVVRQHLPHDLLDIACKGFTAPTPIQAQAWPVMCAERDIIGIAETGSGKTLAFLLPAIARFSRPTKNRGDAPRMLVIAPTRELAMQTADVADKIPLVRSLCVYGGVPKYTQKKALRNGIDLLVATPGRLLDLCTENIVGPDGNMLGDVNFVCLDEADRMLDQGFEQDMRRIMALVGKTPKNGGTRQTALFSATWPESIRKLAREFLDRPVRITIGSDDLTANVRVTQIVEVVEQYEKERKLVPLLAKYHKKQNRILIFALYKKEASRLESFLKSKGYNCCAIHGDKSQEARTSALEGFKNGSVPLLVATDVAARGLDIPNVEYVINVSFPLTIEDYIHRIGRTGRAGKTGVSHTFFTAFDKARSGELQNVLREANMPVPESLMKFGSTVKKKAHSTYGDFGPKADLVGLVAKKSTFSDSDDSDSD